MIEPTPIKEDSDITYSLNEIRQLYTKVHEVEKGNAWLAIHENANGISIEFALFTFVTDNDKGFFVERVLYGSGAASALRELRHTYWGQPDTPGYWYYPDLKAVSMCVPILEEYFDL